MAELKPKSREDLQQIVASAVKDAVDFIDTDVAPQRLKAQEYYEGKVDQAAEEGRSQVVATKVRDTIRQIKPSLMRVFMAHENPVEFEPIGPEDVAFTEAATRFVRAKFERAGGFRLLNAAIDDALRKKTGYLKAFREEKAQSHIYTFTDLTDDELQLVLADPGVEVIEHSATPAPEGQRHDLRIQHTTRKGDIVIEAVPPEEFFIDKNARDIETAYVHGHRTEKTVGDLVAMGFGWDEVSDLGSMRDDGSTMDEERRARRPNDSSTDDQKTPDPALKSVTVTEAYMRVDVDGTGVPVLHRFILGGIGYTLLDYEPCDESPFAKFEIDPEPHAFHGNSIFDLIKNEQDASTATLRGILDNVAMVNTTRTEAVEGQVNLDDLLNNEIGGIVRVRAPGMLRDLSVPFVAGQTLPALQYLDDLVEQKTGVTRASMGLDPDAMQSTTKAAVTATIQAAAGQVEVIVRNLAEGGFKQLFKLILRLVVKHARGPELLPYSGTLIPVDPRVWNVDMDVRVNVGLGTGREEEKAAALAQTLQIQQAIFSQFGPTNGLVSITNIRNTLADMLSAAGIRNVDRYFAPMNPQLEQQLLQQAALAAQGQQQPGDPTQALIAAEQVKASARVQADLQRAQVDLAKAQMLDDRERDKMAQDLFLRAQELVAKTGVQMNTARLKAEQAAQRIPGGGFAPPQAAAPVNSGGM